MQIKPVLSEVYVQGRDSRDIFYFILLKQWHALSYLNVQSSAHNIELVYLRTVPSYTANLTDVVLNYQCVTLLLEGAVIDMSQPESSMYSYRALWSHPNLRWAGHAWEHPTVHMAF